MKTSGNTCFVNAVLQAVAACPSLLLWLEENGNQFPQVSYCYCFSLNFDLYHLKSLEFLSLCAALKTIEILIISILYNNVFQAKEKHHLQTSLLTVLRVINGFDIDVIESSDGESEVGDPEVWAPARLFRALSAHGWVANYQVSSLTQFIFFFNFNIIQYQGRSINLHAF